MDRPQDTGRPRMPGRPSERHAVRARLRRAGLHTVCEEARCPNICECFGRGTATFLILGDRCTRACRFCGIAHGGRPAAPDAAEPQRLAATAAELDLAHVVITSVTRDDLEDGGAGAFVACVEALRRHCPRATVELLVPDFGGRAVPLERVLAAGPDVLNHNLETVARLAPAVRPQADHARSLELLGRAARRGVRLVKSGLMVGLGESDAEIEAALAELAAVGCQVVTIGQYLQPDRRCWPVARRVDEAAWQRYRDSGRRLGISVVAGALVRSSWHAGEVLASSAKAMAAPAERLENDAGAG
jgi:lipoic acid synthetase